MVIHASRGEIAMNHRISQRHRDFAIVLGKRDTAATRDRLVDARNALDRADTPPSSVQILEGNFLLESGYKAMASMLKADSMPTAVFCVNDEMAVGVHRAAPSTETPRPTPVRKYGGRLTLANSGKARKPVDMSPCVTYYHIT